MLRCVLLVVLSLMLGVSAASAQTRTKLTVYTALPAEELPPLKQAAEAAIPTLEIVWVRDPTAPLTQRILAEKPPQRGDMIWGLSAFSLLQLENLNQLESYSPAGADRLRPRFVSDRRPLTWTGMQAVIVALCYNKTLALEQLLPLPRTWQDLMAPTLRRQVAMPNPRLSPDGFLVWAGWVAGMKEGQAWDFAVKLHAAGLHSEPDAAATCEGAARGEVAVGISTDARALALRAQGAPIDVLFPQDGLGYDIEGAAILKGTRNLDLAKRLADFAIGKPAMTIYATTRGLVGHVDIAPSQPGLPPNVERGLVFVDFRSMVLRREAMMQEWATRFGERSAARH
jgi:iron(III) transport system substrate-binding protein